MRCLLRLLCRVLGHSWCEARGGTIRYCRTCQLVQTRLNPCAPWQEWRNR